jgi:hypothetical protein
MRERGDRIKDAAKVFDEMLATGKVKPSLRSGSGSRMRAARTCRCDAARPKRAHVQQQEEEEQLHGMQDDGVQGSRARCGRSCSAMVAGGFAREQ